MDHSRVRPGSASCPICLEFLKNPVTTSCGHSFCMICINKYWNQQQKPFCPQCRETFRCRPVLNKNIVLADLVEQLQKDLLTAPPADHCKPGDISCDSCVEPKLKAAQSCLQCLASFCGAHIQPHYHSPAFETHQLVAPSHDLQDYICSTHNKLKDLFCLTDQECICSLCSVDHHKGHETVSAAKEGAQRQGALESRRNQLLQTIQDQENNLQWLEQEAKVLRSSAQEAKLRSKESHTQLVLLLKKRQSEVEQKIQSELETKEANARELRGKLQRNITELKTTLSDIDALSLIKDHCQFLNKYQALPRETPDLPRIQMRSRPYFEEMTTAVLALSDKVQHALTDSPDLKQVQDLPPQQSTEQFIHYSRQITLDPNSVNTRLSLSEDGKKVTGEEQSYSDHEDRFSDLPQVLSREALTGRCYWEVEWSGECVKVAVAYRSIQRTGIIGCGFGCNDKSWALCCYKNNYEFVFNKVKTEVSGPMSSRIGVYLDHSAGALMFYSVQDRTVTLLHTVQTSFTQPLFAGLCVLPHSTAAFCKPWLKRKSIMKVTPSPKVKPVLFTCEDYNDPDKN